MCLVKGKRKKMDLEKAKQQFIQFANQYDSKNPKVKSRVEHTFRVMQISEEIARKMKLSAEKIELARLIGLLHDIGKFEGLIKGAETSKEHGDMGVEILLEDKFLRKFIQNDTYDTIILTAVKNHSKIKIEGNLSEEEALFCKLIRDADKLDIFYEAAEIFWKDAKEEMENSKIAVEVEAALKVGKVVERKQGEKFKGVDRVLHIIGFIYDLNFQESFQIIKENNNINKILDRFDYQIPETKEKMKKITKTVNQYINQKI